MDARSAPDSKPPESRLSAAMLTHLQRLEAEAIHIFREVVAECERPVMLYSIGKDSAVMLRLAQKAFHPSKPPFPLLHIDTTWKFKAMDEMRERMARESGMELLIHQNPEAIARGINPFDQWGVELGKVQAEALVPVLRQVPATASPAEWLRGALEATGLG